MHGECRLTLVSGRWTCPQCGWVYRLESEKPPRRNCPAAEGSRQRADGSEVVIRGDDEITRCRLVCSSCEEFAGDRCRACRQCASEAAAVYESRLRVGDCPRGKWPHELAR